MKANLSVAVVGALSDGKFRSKVSPLLELPELRKVYLFRRAGNPFGESSMISLLQPPLAKWWRGSAYQAFVAARLALLCLMGKVDAIVGVYMLPHGTTAGVVGRLLGVPVIQILPGSDVALVESRPLLTRIVRSAAAVGVRGEHSRRRLHAVDVRPDRIFVQHNRFELPRLAHRREVAKVWDLMTIAYLRAPKRIDSFLACVRMLVQELPAIRCAVVGDGPERARLEALARKMEVDGNVAFLGHREDVALELSRARVFVLTSESEGLPMALVEAMSCGVPVVASAIGEIPDLVEEGVSGFLIESGHVAEYAHACKRLLTNPTACARMGAQARHAAERLVATDFSAEATRKTWSAALMRAVGG